MNPVVETFGPEIMVPEGIGSIRLISNTPMGEHLIAYVARVSSKNQEKEDIKGLLTYCLKHGHVSVFEQADMTIEINCPLAIAIQILRHRSFTFQQFSQRYADINILDNFAYLPRQIREQDTKNRQNSLEFNGSNSEETRLLKLFENAMEQSKCYYDELIRSGVAKELARFVLPEGVMSKLYMKGNIRSWIFYLKVRNDPGVAQYEHVLLAKTIYEKIFKPNYPIISSMMEEMYN